MRMVLTSIWFLVVSLCASALLISTDADVGGVEGLAEPGVLLTVTVWALPPVVLMGVGLGIWRRRGFRAFLGETRGHEEQKG